jgi:amino acid adenylation domain-containing protein
MAKKIQIPFTKEELLHDYWGCVDKVIGNFSSKDFIVTKYGSVTYGEAISFSTCVYHLIKNNTSLQSIGVGLFLRDPRKVIPCMLGVLKSGNYFIPLDVEYPETTLQSMIQDAGIKLILTVSEYKQRILSIVGKDITILDLDDIDQTLKLPIPQVTYSLEDIAQIMFTSGSSGRPKGAVEDYRYLIRSAYIKMATYEYEQSDKILQLSSFTYSGPHTLIFAALLMGITICYHNVRVEGFSGLPQWIREMGVTIFTASPPTFRSLVGILSPKESFPTVRTFYLGGDKRLKNDIEAIKKHFPKAKRIRLSYTGTEIQAVSSWMVSIEQLMHEEILPSGKPYDDIKIYIWDKNGNRLPNNEEGEIVVYGDALARGYVNNAELTKQKFIPDQNNPPWQYYKTGDLGKLQDDGQLVHLGRIDNMVKIRGVRIELDNLENQILSYPGIMQVASKVFESTQGTKKLACYFVAEKGISIPTSDLRKHLTEKLPLQQLPNYLINLSEMPLTTSGKIAFNLLPQPNTVRSNLANKYEPPTNQTEQKLVSIFEEQIGITGIGVTDDFFELGGDSLLGVLVFVAIEESFGLELPVSFLLKDPTIRGLANLINSNDSYSTFQPLIPIRTTGKTAPLFFIPGRGGYPTRIRHLANKISIDTPVYAFQDLRDDIDLRLENRAAFFLKEIQKVNPAGPYILIGESLGGKVAYEIAQQLIAGGEKEPLLVLLDTYNTGNSLIDNFNNKHSIRYFKMLIQKHLSIWLKSDRQGKKEYIEFYRETINDKLKKFIRPKINKPHQEQQGILPKNVLKLEKDNRVAVKLYEVKPYPGKVILVKATRGPNSNIPANGWDKVKIGNLIIEELDCYHGSILFEPAVSNLAKLVKNYIAQYSKPSD